MSQRVAVLVRLGRGGVQHRVQLTGLIGAQIQVSYSLCGFWGSDVEGHEAARQLTQIVNQPCQSVIGFHNDTTGHHTASGKV